MALELVIPALTQSTLVPKLQYPCSSGGETYNKNLLHNVQTNPINSHESRRCLAGRFSYRTEAGSPRGKSVSNHLSRPPPLSSRFLPWRTRTICGQHDKSFLTFYKFCEVTTWIYLHRKGHSKPLDLRCACDTP